MERKNDVSGSWDKPMTMPGDFSVCSCGICGQVWMETDDPDMGGVLIADITAHFEDADKQGIPHQTHEQAQAHARLFAASPIMYHALSMLLDRLDQFGCIDLVRDEGPVQDARRALAKASGVGREE